MRPKVEFILTLSISLLVIIGILTLLLITSTPRSIGYTLSSIGCPSKTTELLIEDIPIPRGQETMSLYDVLYRFGIIRTPEDLTDTDLDLVVYDTLSAYVDNPGEIPMTMLYQADPGEIVSTREYMRYQETGKRTLYFIENKTAQEYVITAYNYNLRSRQTAIFVFYGCNEDLRGYVLNNVWMRPRNYTFINLLVDEETPVLITDLDNNVYEVC